MKNGVTLSAQLRTLLFAAALLHNIGKPTTTRTEPHGRISSPKHAQVGAQIARTLLYTGDSIPWPPPCQQRELIVYLVRQHGLPLWTFERKDPRCAQRVVIE